MLRFLNYGQIWQVYINTYFCILVMFYSEIKLDEAAVLHYTYPKFSDLTSRRDRCGCKPTKEDVKRCFMLEFDRAVSSYPCVIVCILLLPPLQLEIMSVLFS